MLWSRKSNREKVKKLESQVSFEVQKHKKKSAEAAAKTEELTRNLNRLLISNGITIKIHLARGGHVASGGHR